MVSVTNWPAALAGQDTNSIEERRVLLTGNCRTLRPAICVGAHGAHMSESRGY
jgi:hypothetical protein